MHQARYYRFFDILIEFKYVNFSDAGLTGEVARKLPWDDLVILTPVQNAWVDGEKQVKAYRKALNEKYPDLNIKRFVVVALGFERLCWLEVI